MSICNRLQEKLHPVTAQVGIFVWIKLQFHGTNIFILFNLFLQKKFQNVQKFPIYL